MLKRLTVRNYALIGELDISFPEGLVIITGETGAGKSILLGALSLVMGARADLSVIRERSGNCVVEAEFVYDASTGVPAILEKGGFEPDGSLIIRRVLSPTGRSRSFLNDEPVSVSFLSELSSALIDIHAQNQHLVLADRNFHRRLLDYYAGIRENVAAYESVYADYRRILGEIDKVKEEIKRYNSESEYRKFQYDSLVAASLVPGELEELEAAHNELVHSEDIKNHISTVNMLLSGQEMPVTGLLKEVNSHLDKLSSYSDRFAPLSERLHSCRIELEDIASEVASADSDFSFSPQSLEQMEERMSLIYSLMKKFSASDVDELIRIRDSYRNDIDEGESLVFRLDELERRKADVYASLKDMASSLSEKRAEAAPVLSEALQRTASSLEMPHCAVEYMVSPLQELTSSGCDDVEMLFSANGRDSLAAISGKVSGGEMSRLALAVKSVMAEYTGMPTMIFDEIDTGVSGRVADRMGSLVCSMGERMQVFAITHLPQMASKGDAHYLVYKEFDADGNASSGIRRLSAEERVAELAKMLSGSTVSGVAMENARELLKKRNN